MCIKNLVSVFMECRRILKKEGMMWIVIGDSYASCGRGWSGKTTYIPVRLCQKLVLAPDFQNRTKLSVIKIKS